jgi:hypothetical protein
MVKVNNYFWNNTAQFAKYLKFNFRLNIEKKEKKGDMSEICDLVIISFMQDNLLDSNSNLSLPSQSFSQPLAP